MTSEDAQFNPDDPAGRDSSPALEIAHVLFMDLVGYSMLPMEQQNEFVGKLQAVVRKTPGFLRAQQGGSLVRLPTGDGMALVFFGDPVAPIECALEVSRAFKSDPKLKLRMGLNTGPVYRVTDINGNENASGGAINLAQRVMDCGGAGHILVAQSLADVLSQSDKWAGHLHDLGEYEVKHGVRVHLFNLYTSDAGNPAPLTRVRKHVPPGKARIFRYIAGALLTTLAVSLIWFRLHSVVPQEKLVAVLPFQNVTGNPSNQAFCDGIVETVSTKITELEQFHSLLWVVPQSEVRRQSVYSAREAKRVFGVTLVLTGSVQRTTERLRLTINLIDANTLLQLRATTIDIRNADVSSLQDEVASRCAQLLELELQQRAHLLLAAGGTGRSTAFDPYLQGQGYLLRFDEPGYLDKAIAQFQLAIEKDPEYALAHNSLCKAYWKQYQLTKDGRSVAQARNSCLSALRLNDQIAATHVNLGLIYAGTGHSDEAIGEFRRALALDPVNADAYRGLAGVYNAMGNAKEAEAVFKRAIELRPDQWVGYSYLGLFYYTHGRYRDAEPMFHQVIAHSPGYYLGYNLLGGLYLAMGRLESAAEQLEKALKIRPMPNTYDNLAEVYLFQGRYKQGVEMMNKAIELRPNDYRFWGTLADLYRSIPEMAGKSSEAYRKAIDLAERQLALDQTNGEVLSDAAVYHAKTGNIKQALEQIERSRTLTPDNKDVVQNSVIVYEVAGRRDRALIVLEEAVKQNYPLADVSREQTLSGLRKDPRYQRIMRGNTPGVPIQ